MHPRFIHIFHLIPLFVFANMAGQRPDILHSLNLLHANLPMIICSTIVYLSVIWRDSALQRFIFISALLLMTALTLLRLWQHPSIATLVGAAFCMMVIPKSTQPFSYKRVFLTSNLSVLVSFGISSIFYAMLFLDVFQTSSTLFWGALLSFISVIFIGCGKLKVNSSFTYALIITVLAVGLYSVYHEPKSIHLVPASVAYVLCVITTILSLLYVNIKRDFHIGDRFFSQPEIIILIFFTAFAALGTLLLQVPMAQAQSSPHSVVDSLFTAMSAVCVTGLVVLDTPVDFSFFGQGVILILIQIGGLGIVSLSAWVLFVFQSKRLSVHHEQTITQLSAYKHNISPKEMIGRILGYFITFELVGALILFFAFASSGDSLGMAAWRALFTAISAFCNAGFAIQSASLIPYQSNSLIMTTISVLIIAGGFAPILVLSLPRRSIQRWSLQAKISLSTTFILLVSGLVLFLLFEWHHSLSGLTIVEKFTNAWFQSVTTRTAGFNSINLMAMRDVTIILFMILMFIGGNPGSAAGGIKTVTAAVIFFAAFSTLRGGKEARAFNRSMSVEVVYKAIAIASLGLATGFMAFLMLAMTQNVETIPLLFETVSALGTVGLSLDVTGSLDTVGKFVIMLCMLVGRVGPVTFALTLLRGASEKKWDVPEEDVYVS